MLDENELLFDELYEKTKDCGRVQFIKLLMEKERANQELKKQLDELQALYNNMFKCHCNRVQVETLLKQQKKFIRLLEKEIVDSSAGSGHQYYAQQHLRLYKEIIGDKDE